MELEIIKAFLSIISATITAFIVQRVITEFNEKSRARKNIISRLEYELKKLSGKRTKKEKLEGIKVCEEKFLESIDYFSDGEKQSVKNFIADFESYCNKETPKLEELETSLADLKNEIIGKFLSLRNVGLFLLLFIIIYFLLSLLFSAINPIKVTISETLKGDLRDIVLNKSDGTALIKGEGLSSGIYGTKSKIYFCSQNNEIPWWCREATVNSNGSWRANQHLGSGDPKTPFKGETKIKLIAVVDIDGNTPQALSHPNDSFEIDDITKFRIHSEERDITVYLKPENDNQ